MSRRLGALAAALVVVACSTRAQRAHRASPVVARVDGEAVTADEVAAIARADRVPAREALDRAVRDRLLVREARRLGVVDDDDADTAAWHAAVQMVLARDVEGPNTPERVPRGLFDAIFQRRRVELVHDGLVRVVHALAVVDADAGAGARDAARALIARFHARAAAEGGALTAARFEAIAHEFPGLRVEGLDPFDRTGQAADGTQFVEPFVRAAWSLSESAPLSAPFDSQFGVHVALRTGAVPPLSRPPQEVHDAVARDAVVMMRARALTQLLERLRARSDVRLSESALGATARAAEAPPVAAPR